ncbi:hypothetical protein F5887DRAFT_962841 [Amanita rubescens]|nr:hypothetical protein F5887DRAFT_962841 [Amanita rubescens]
MHTTSSDNNPRPLKRQRIESLQDTDKDASNLNPIPCSTLLLALPSILIHPPMHPHHQTSLQLSSAALKKCLELPEIEGDLECRAWTALAEMGIIEGTQEPGTAEEVEKAISKALLIAQKHPSLRLYKPHLSLLSAKVAYHHQNNPKQAAQIVRRLLNTLTSSDPPHVTYTAHLALIFHSEMESSMKMLDSVQNFQTLATNNGHTNVALLAQVIRLRILLGEGLWPIIGTSLNEAEEAFQIKFPDSSAALPLATEVPAAETALRLHVLIMGIIYYTYAGDTENASLRLSRLHELLDKGALTMLGDSGVVEFPLAGERTLYVQMTHPRALYLLAFLISSVSKRNPIGRKPKRKVFATEGLAIAERELKKEILLSQWTSIHDAKDAYSRIHKLKADMLSELVARALDCYKVAAHLSQSRTRADNLYGCKDSRLRTPKKWAPSPTRTSRVPNLSPTRQTTNTVKKRSKSKGRLGGITEDDNDDEPYPEDTWVHASARAGEMWLRIGLIRQRARNQGDNEDSARLAQEEIGALAAEGEAVALQCEGLGGTLRAIGEVLKACLSNEVLKSKAHLRTALDVASSSQDNHLRALIIALISSHYFHTARNHAENMLLTCEQLAAGMGAQSRPSTNDNNSTGKPPLTTSDKDPNKDAFSTTKPRSKRKASEVEPDENSMPSARPLKEKSNDSDSLLATSGRATEEKVKIHEATVRSIEQLGTGVINVG